MTAPIPVILEVAPKRTMASAVDWPGWCRGARREEEALASLAAYAPRYARVAERAGLSSPQPVEPASFEVVERLGGGSGTEFGIPSRSPTTDDRPIDTAELERLVALLGAAWAAFDAAAEEAVGVELRKGPRGGGRDLAKIVLHVLEAEEAYVTQLGARPPRHVTDPAAALIAVRDACVTALDARARGQSIATPSGAKKVWLPRYFVRRSTWHALDHAWEIEDRATPTDEA